MEIEKGPLDGLWVLRPRVFEDARGFFFESFNEERFRELGISQHWAQDNHAMSVRNTVRGLHFQRGRGQAKLTRCVRGAIWDAVADIRPDSPTLGQWYGLELSAANRKMLYVPEGFAHGYAVLSEEAEVLYKCSTVYAPDLEDEVKWDDPDLGVAWPVETPVLSQRDMNAQSFRDYLASLQQGGSRA